MNETASLFAVISIPAVIAFVIGIIFFIIEMFTAGFGLAGGIGLVAFIVSVILQARSIAEALIMIVIIGGLIAALLFLISRSATKGSLFRSSLILKNIASRDAGFYSNTDLKSLVGKTGVTLTILRPAGTAKIDGQKVDVVTEGDFIGKDEKIVVVSVSGRRITVGRPEDEI